MALTSAVARLGFSYAGDSLFAEASNNNRHRRATVAELKAHFKGTGQTKDPPAHWYEAQLKHYGLPPSKIKGTAYKRLHDAVNAGNLKVPADIQKIEGDLKKEWNKQERGAKKALKDVATATTTAPKATKRKAEQGPPTTGTNINLNLSVSVTSTGELQVQGVEPASKKAKTTKASSTATPSKGKTPKAKEKPATTKAPKPSTQTAAAAKPAKSTPKPKTSRPKSTSTAAQKADAAPRKQTAKRGGASVSGRTANPRATQSSSSGPPRAKQTARRGGSFARGRTTLSAAPVNQYPVPASNDFDEPPPPYSEFPDEDGGYDSSRGGGYDSSRDRGYDSSRDGGYESRDEDGGYDSCRDKGYETRDEDGGYDSPDEGGSSWMDNPEPPRTIRPLGLLNGRYEIRCPLLEQAFPQYDGDFGLIATLDGNKLWMKFDFGAITGLISHHRPWGPTDGSDQILWRGHAIDQYGDRCFLNRDSVYRARPEDAMEFLGGGEITGRISDEDGTVYEFHGTRISGQQTRSEISPAEMRETWEELGQEAL